MERHDDDKPVGRILSRREMLALLGGTGAVFLFGASVPRIITAQGSPTATPAPSSTPLPACVVRPELTEGPYFVDGQLNRSDIRIDPSDDSVKEGFPLRIVFRVSDTTGGMCAPLAGAQVDVWHCDADGVYSGVQDASFDTTDQMWLRGYQITGEDGHAEFITIYPGWYAGRAVHIHFKIRTDPSAAQSYEFTSQFFFPEEITDIVHAQPPYAAKGYRNVLNAQDNIFRDSNGLLTLDLVEAEIDGQPGYSATFDIGLDLSDAEVGADDGGASGGDGRPGRRP
jgi:protocatechuate 3,4-dioxygenase beta subunit